MRELIVRGVSGLLYVVLILSSLFFHQLTFSIVLMIFSTLAILEFHRLINHKSFLAIALLLLLVYNFYQSHIDQSVLIFPLAANLVCQIFLLERLFFEKSFKFNYGFKSFLSICYLAFGCFFIIALAGTDENYQPKTLLLFYLLVWVNNSFAYFVGKKLGKKPLFPSISPKKTWEGFLGGLFFKVITAVIFQQFQLDFSLGFYIIFGIVIAILATIGDLIQSKFKRHADVKDSGSLIPGHGGFFDRMDSVIFSSPWIYLIINLHQYVS